MIAYVSFVLRHSLFVAHCHCPLELVVLMVLVVLVVLGRSRCHCHWWAVLNRCPPGQR